MTERARLNNLLSNLQSMQNDRERQENESRRRSLQETERLEQEVQTLKSKLTEESEETKRLSARREYESRDLQERINKVSAELSLSREQLASATTARDQLQARVEEQAILLRSSEEKLVALSKPGSSQDVNHEQQLGVEVAELKKALELTKTELRDAKEYAEKMKEISATAEEALQEMNMTHDSFKESIDQQLADKEVFSPTICTNESPRLQNSKSSLKLSSMSYKRAIKNSQKSVNNTRRNDILWNMSSKLCNRKLLVSRMSRKKLNYPKDFIKKIYVHKLILLKKLNAIMNAN